MTSLNDFARELAASADSEVGIPWGVFERACDARGINWHEPCDACHGDGTHETWCPEGLCRTCETPGCDGNCVDRVFETAARK